MKIIYEDESLVVIDKPSGITVNRSDTTGEEVTVQDWIDKKFSISKPKLSNSEESDFYRRSGIAHRIDKETSGILIIAKNTVAFELLQKQFKERLVEKSYTALVHGLVGPEAGEIKVPIGRLPWNRKRFGVLAGGREAVTKYQVLSILYLVSNRKREPLSLVRLRPKTGRTHQIRVHLKYINHPIFSDPLYAGRKTSRDDRKYLARLFLHASKISFIHPQTGERIYLESELPKELSEFLGTLK